MPHTRARTWLDAHRNADGSWGYVPGNDGAGEPTLLAVAAGRTAPLAWLADAELGWSQLLLPACLSQTPGADALVEHARATILDSRGEMIRTNVEFDTSIPAWSWFPNTSPWAEPTAYAVLSLRHLGLHDHPRCVDGVAMLLNRQCDDGGWNYGNPEILGARLASDLASTARVAIALPTSAATARALTRLRDALTLPSTEHLALAALAHLAHDADPAPFLAALAPRQAPNGAFTDRVDRTALAAMAFAAAAGEPIALLPPRRAP